jgi:beta-galactosidase
VPYAAGAIEARGFKSDNQVMTATRETTGAPAKLLMTTDRTEVSADGEDVAMFTVAVHDANGRFAAIADNEVTFRVSGAGKLIGVGNGDPTDHESDKGTSRKAFSGLCMAIVQTTKTAGSITVEATSSGLAPSTVTISAKATTLRPQVAVWEREVPAGSGITGLWRPMPQEGNELMSFLGVGGSMIFTLRQDGSNLTGTVEGTGRSFTGGNDVPAPITEGKVEGDRISFKVGRRDYTGTVKSDRIELEQTIEFPFKLPEPAKQSANRPAVGPPPDGSDPSIGSWRIPKSVSMVLQRAQR